MKPYIVAIAGGSGSGKTTLLNLLSEEVKTPSSLIETDHYYLDRSKIPPAQRESLNYDHPDSVDFSLLVEHLGMLRLGEKISYPQYDFKTHTRTTTKALNPKALLFVEGIFALYDPRIIKMIDLGIYVECDADMRLSRRILRDIETRGRSLRSVISQYEDSVKKMHTLYIEPTKFNADLITPWQKTNPKIIGAISSLIVSKIK